MRATTAIGRLRKIAAATKYAILKHTHATKKRSKPNAIPGKANASATSWYLAATAECGTAAQHAKPKLRTPKRFAAPSMTIAPNAPPNAMTATNCPTARRRAFRPTRRNAASIASIMMTSRNIAKPARRITPNGKIAPMPPTPTKTPSTAATPQEKNATSQAAKMGSFLRLKNNPTAHRSNHAASPRPKIAPPTDSIRLSPTDIRRVWD